MPGDRSVYGQRFAESLRLVTGEAGYYACPLCLTRFPLAEINSLTWDHYPPRSIGGLNGDTVLVCKECQRKWSDIDVELHYLQKAQEHNRAHPGTIRGKLKFPDTPGLTGSNQHVALELPSSPEGFILRMIILLEASPQAATTRIDEQHQQLAATGGVVHLQGTFPLYPYDIKTAELALLKAAYLAAFDCLGYRYILSPALATIRLQLLHPETVVFVAPVARMLTPAGTVAPDIVIGYITAPEPATSLLVNFRGYALNPGVAVFLPLPARPTPIDDNYLHYLQTQPEDIDLHCRALDRDNPDYLTAPDVWFTDDEGRRRSYYEAE